MKSLKSAFILLILLTACAAPTPVATPAPTIPSIPTSPPPTPTVAPTPTPDLVTMDELGITDYRAKQTFGEDMPKTVTREADGSYSVNAIGYEGENKTEKKYTIDTSSWNLNTDIKNAYAPATVNATDEEGNQVTLIWSAEQKAWRVPFAMIPDTELNKIDQHPFVPEGDEKIAVESALLWFRDNPPFTDAAVENYKEYGGNVVNAGFDTIVKGNAVFLRPEAIQSENNAHPNADNSTIKFSPLWIRQNINGKLQDINIIVNLDSPDKNNYKVLLGIPMGMSLSEISATKGQDGLNEEIQYYYGDSPFYYPFVALYADQDPDIKALLALPNNDPGKLTFPGYNGQYKFYDIFYKLKSEVNNDPTIFREFVIGTKNPNGGRIYMSFPPEIQIMRLPVTSSRN
ncbi:MAG: hypothetical protein JW963_26010 [Anaerolineales bacterium]|nr:hypothetical protein [Anaerolineales bacterium]